MRAGNADSWARDGPGVAQVHKEAWETNVWFCSGRFADAPVGFGILPPPPPGPPGACGDVGDLCCEGQKCTPGATCNAYEIYYSADYFPDANTCVECGGEEGVEYDYRFGQLACTGAAHYALDCTVLLSVHFRTLGIASEPVSRRSLAVSVAVQDIRTKI